MKKVLVAAGLAVMFALAPAGAAVAAVGGGHVAAVTDAVANSYHDFAIKAVGSYHDFAVQLPG